MERDGGLKPLNDLLQRIKEKLSDLEKELERADSHWGGEDLFYRYYHNSFKVYQIQSYTKSIVRLLQSLAPAGGKLNEDFLRIIEQGTGRVWESEHNQDWDKNVRPQLEAFFHAREMLRLAIKYGQKLDTVESILPSGWAAVLYLYNLR